MLLLLTVMLCTLIHRGSISHYKLGYLLQNKAASKEQCLIDRNFVFCILVSYIISRLAYWVTLSFVNTEV